MARQATETKKRIMQVARSLYSTHGYGTTTVDDVITASGITKGAFYHYFKSKSDLCEDIVDEAIADYHELTASIDADLEPIAQLSQMINRLDELHTAGYWVNCRLMLRLLAELQQFKPQLQGKLRDFWEWYTEFFEDLIAKCQEQGQMNSTPNAKIQAQMLVSVLTGAVALEKVLPSKGFYTVLAEVLLR